MYLLCLFQKTQIAPTLLLHGTNKSYVLFALGAAVDVADFKQDGLPKSARPRVLWPSQPNGAVVAHGYIYVLTNRAMPGVVKIGRTERDPSDRARELRTTGVPSPFELVHSSLVDDCESVEKHIHRLLAERGVRFLPDREFFEVSSTDAIELIELVARQSIESIVDFSRSSELSKLAHSLQIPLGNELISEAKAMSLADRLTQIGRQGYPNALKMSADIFEVNHPSALKFRELWREYLELAGLEAERRPVASGGRAMRNAVGRDAAEYLQRLNRHHGWLLPLDFLTLVRFLYQATNSPMKVTSPKSKDRGFPQAF